MKTRSLGRSGLTVSALGLGCMSMSEFYGPGDDAESTATIHRAIELGVTFFDRSEEHTSELQSRGHLVCRLLLEKKNTNNKQTSSERDSDETRHWQRTLLKYP